MADPTNVSMIADDRFPDVPVSTQGNNPWNDNTLGAPLLVTSNIDSGENVITVGDRGGVSMVRARPNGRGTFHIVEVPNATSGAGFAAGRP